MSAIGEFLAASNLLPHGHCLFWRPDLLLLHVISDALIALAYFSIPLALIELLRRRKDLVFNQVFLLFAAFITACGLTHIFNLADIWFALYPLSGLMKAFTAFISLVTAVACWKLLPAAVALPSPKQLSDEVERRKLAESDLRQHNDRLELRVAERTAELSAVNQQLVEEIKTRSQLQKRAEFLAAVVDWSDDAIVRISTDHVIEAWNRGAEKLYGYNEDEAIGQPISMLFPEGEDATHLLSANPKQAEATTAEVVRVTKAGEKIHVLLTISPIRDSDSDELIGFAGISRSIQERYEAEQKIKHTADVLRKTNSDLKDFVYIASHDLQEPLRLITSYLNIINEDYGEKFDDDGRRYVSYVLDSAERLQQLINDLLSYSRLNTSEQPIALADTKDILKQVIADSRVLIEEKSGQITAATDLPIINCDQSQLRLVLSNLINNALKYSQDEQPPSITVSASQNENETLFEVADNGIGFEPKQAERIFQVFRRLHPRHKYSGTGIGLSICKKIVERHGGRIWAESEPGVGSKFFFTIPKQINPELGELS